MKFRKLDNDNFLMFAIQHYDNPSCKGMDEFYEDLSIIIYLKRLFKKYRVGGEINERLILNHIIVFYNVFGIEGATQILFKKISKEDHSSLKTFLIYLSYIKPDKKYDEWNLDLSSIPVDLKLAEILRNIK